MRKNSLENCPLSSGVALSGLSANAFNLTATLWNTLPTSPTLHSHLRVSIIYLSWVYPTLSSLSVDPSTQSWWFIWVYFRDGVIFVLRTGLFRLLLLHNEQHRYTAWNCPAIILDDFQAGLDPADWSFGWSCWPTQFAHLGILSWTLLIGGLQPVYWDGWASLLPCNLKVTPQCPSRDLSRWSPGAPYGGG